MKKKSRVRSCNSTFLHFVIDLPELRRLVFRRGFYLPAHSLEAELIAAPSPEAGAHALALMEAHCHVITKFFTVCTFS